MPAFDGTGPRGEGPLTGRGMGPCGRGFRRGFGRGFGFRRGFGRGMGRAWRYPCSYDYPVYPALSKEEEKSMLEDELKLIQKDMDDIKKRIEELKE